ncbi:MAG: hypothetical protein RLZZ519_2072 [Bacteroidota bacterium]
MKRLSILSLLIVLTSVVWSQSVPRFAKYDIAETGCKVYLPEDPGEFEMSLSEDNSEVFTGEVTHNDFNFGVILVKFSEPIGKDKETMNDMITSYLDFLQTQFGVTGSAGYGLGHTLESAPDAVGVIDYWEDADGLQYAIKSWCDGDFLAVLMLYGAEEYPIFNAQQMFLEGFRFPEK